VANFIKVQVKSDIASYTNAKTKEPQA